jgi:dTDP-4-dehydrorhamnose reductase
MEVERGKPDARAPVRFLVTGGTGQVGFELIHTLASLGEVIAPPRAELDLSKLSTIREVIQRVAPTVIVNAAAYTAVDRAESEREACFTVNATAPGVLAEEARRIGAVLIHYSTDYVFDGRKREPYVETDEPAPLNIYGESKLAGERAIADVGGAWIVLRTSWVYGARGNNFMRKILRLAREGEELRVVDDQIGAPTWSRAIAETTAQLLAPCGSPNRVDPSRVAEHNGVYHISASGATSWHGFAVAIVRRDRHQSGDQPSRVVPISSSELRTLTRRPTNSLLDNSRIAGTFAFSMPSWEEQLDRVWTQL